MMNYFQQMVAKVNRKKGQSYWIPIYNIAKQTKTLTELRKQQYKSIPNTFRLFEKYTGRYLYDTGDREEFHKADNTDWKDHEANVKPQFTKEIIMRKYKPQLGNDSCYSYY